MEEKIINWLSEMESKSGFGDEGYFNLNEEKDQWLYVICDTTNKGTPFYDVAVYWGDNDTYLFGCYKSLLDSVPDIMQAYEEMKSIPEISENFHTIKTEEDLHRYYKDPECNLYIAAPENQAKRPQPSGLFHLQKTMMIIDGFSEKDLQEYCFDFRHPVYAIKGTSKEKIFLHNESEAEIHLTAYGRAKDIEIVQNNLDLYYPEFFPFKESFKLLSGDDEPIRPISEEQIPYRLSFKGIWEGDVQNLIKLTHHAEALYENTELENVHVEIYENGNWHGREEPEIEEDLER